MATRVNLMKLLQEVRGLSEISTRRPALRAPAPALLPLRGAPRPATVRRKRHIRILMREPLDIPTPVKITYIKNGLRSGAIGAC